MSPFYLERPFQLVARRCVEHGISQVHQATREHSMKLRLARRGSNSWEEPVGERGSMFEFQMLMIGWAAAGAVFAGELFISSGWAGRMSEQLRVLRDWAKCWKRGQE